MRIPVVCGADEVTERKKDRKKEGEGEREKEKERKKERKEKEGGKEERNDLYQMHGYTCVRRLAWSDHKSLVGLTLSAACSWQLSTGPLGTSGIL